MIVMKFGGTSVGSAERMLQVLQLITEAKNRGTTPVVVLSAMSGITNALIEGARKAVRRDLTGALTQLEFIRTKHVDAVNELFVDDTALTVREELLHEIEARMEELGILYKGINYLGELTKRSLDAVSGLGELLSSIIFAALAKNRGLGSQWLDARQLMITDDHFGRANPEWEEVTERCRNAIVPLASKGEVVITQGFIGATRDGAQTTLGRGGSDYSASIFGVASDATEIQIWTDVDGMMTADPRVIPSARVLPEVSFEEASELAYFGAKVLHPSTIKPAVEKDIPVRILNTLRPEAPGTIIKSRVKATGIIRAIASKKGIASIFIRSPKMLMSHGFLANVFAIFDKHKTPIDLISTSEISVALTIDYFDHLEDLTEDLKQFGDIHVLHGVAIVTVVGRQFREQTGIAGKVFNCLRDKNILMISGGASDINLSFVVVEDDADDCVRRLHDEFFTDSQQ
jgi:aspartate kinase